MKATAESCLWQQGSDDRPPPVVQVRVEAARANHAALPRRGAANLPQIEAIQTSDTPSQSISICCVWLIMAGLSA